jgi:hypothetical protein
VNKKVNGRRKRKPEKKYKGESRYRKSTNGKVKGQKEKRKREEERKEEVRFKQLIHDLNPCCVHNQLFNAYFEDEFK